MKPPRSMPGPLVGPIDSPSPCPHCSAKSFAQPQPLVAVPPKQQHEDDASDDWQERFFHDKHHGCEDSISNLPTRAGNHKRLPNMLSTEEQRRAEERDEYDKPPNPNHRLTYPERSMREMPSSNDRAVHMQSPIVNSGPHFGTRNVCEEAARHSIHHERNAAHGPQSRASSYGGHAGDMVGYPYTPTGYGGLYYDEPHGYTYKTTHAHQKGQENPRGYNGYGGIRDHAHGYGFANPNGHRYTDGFVQPILS